MEHKRKKASENDETQQLEREGRSWEKSTGPTNSKDRTRRQENSKKDLGGSNSKLEKREKQGEQLRRREISRERGRKDSKEEEADDDDGRRLESQE